MIAYWQAEAVTADGIPEPETLFQSPGGSARLAANFFVNATRMLDGNVTQLLDHLRGEEAVFIPDQDAFLDEAQRHTFNAVMASLAIRDLSHRVLAVAIVAKSGLPEANRRRVAVFSNVPIAVVGELRDHLAHRSLPPLLLRTRLESGGGFKYTTVLSRGPLIRDKKVKSAVRQYLSDLDDDLAFRPLVTDYFKEQLNWANWFHNELLTRCAAHLAELDAALAFWGGVTS